jgi:hypothetical protein
MLVKIFLAESGARENFGKRRATGVLKKLFCWDLVYEIFKNIVYLIFLLSTESRCCVIFVVVFEAATRCRSGCCSDDLGTRCSRTGDPGTVRLVSYPLDHVILVDRTILELSDELWGRGILTENILSPNC